MHIGNWLRRKLNRPVRFDLDAAIDKARSAARHELARLDDPDVAKEVARWQQMSDRSTDGIDCGTGKVSHES